MFVRAFRSQGPRRSRLWCEMRHLSRRGWLIHAVVLPRYRRHRRKACNDTQLSDLTGHLCSFVDQQPTPASHSSKTSCAHCLHHVLPNCTEIKVLPAITGAWPAANMFVVNHEKRCPTTTHTHTQNQKKKKGSRGRDERACVAPPQCARSTAGRSDFLLTAALPPWCFCLLCPSHVCSSGPAILVVLRACLSPYLSPPSCVRCSLSALIFFPFPVDRWRGFCSSVCLGCCHALNNGPTDRILGSPSEVLVFSASKSYLLPSLI